ncbi:unnamed protein product [Symbiodinium sp. CCMP2456]|nr:unnamed protein product [Symbiodinium sp. CCMP2456]
MKSRFGHMDGEVHPPGQNPGYHNPWVTMPHQIVPSPNTPQYGGPWPTAPQMQLPSGPRQGAWVQVQLRSAVDAETDTIAEKLHTLEGDLPWMYAEVDGWALNFYPEAKGPRPPRCASSVDLRSLRRVEVTAQVLGPFVVSMIMEPGTFKFYTYSQEEAEQWRQTLTSVFVQFRQVEIHRRASPPKARPVSSAAPGVPAGAMAVRRTEAPSSSRSQGPLRDIYASCIEAVVQGQAPGPELFECIFQLYDVNGDGDLAFEELQQMVRDLLLVRKAEVQCALQRRDLMTKAVILDAHSQITLRTASATMSRLGERLLSDYESRLEKDGFESRCILLQSQLDLSADQRVALPEFLAGAPRILLPESELRAEAVFFETCSKAMRMQKKAEHLTKPAGGESDEEDEGICVQQ